MTKQLASDELQKHHTPRKVTKACSVNNEGRTQRGLLPTPRLRQGYDRGSTVLAQIIPELRGSLSQNRRLLKPSFLFLQPELAYCMPSRPMGLFIGLNF